VPIRHVERAENAERLDGSHQRIAAFIERGNLIVAVRAVLLVHDHLAPVLDEQIAGGDILIVQERAAKVGAVVTVHQRPRAVRAVEVLELGLLARPHVELPDDGNHGVLRPRFRRLVMAMLQARFTPVLTTAHICAGSSRARHMPSNPACFPS